MDNKSLRITLARPPRNTMDLITARCCARRRGLPGSGDTHHRLWLRLRHWGDVRECSSARKDPASLLLKDLATHLHAAVSRLVRSRAGDRRDPRTSGSAYRAPLR